MTVSPLDPGLSGFIQSRIRIGKDGKQEIG